MCTANPIVAAMWTTEMQQSTFDDSHRQVVSVLAKLQHAEINEKLADIEAGLQNTQRRDVRLALQNVINCKQNNFVVDSTIFGDVKRRAWHFSLIQARVDDVRVRLRAKHLRFEDSSCAAVDADGVEL